jgi:tRNA pseudouridine13 synthase
MPFDTVAPPPLLTAELPGIGGRIKQLPEDFDVEEIPAYEPCGSGEYLYLWIEKRELGAEYFVRQLARKLDIPVGEVGTAGLKDRHAITRQMVSVPLRVENLLDRINGDGMTLLKICRHDNKLKPGHLRGNRFRVLVRDPVPEVADRLPALLERLKSHGLPNYYGPQRFGRDGETLRIGLALLNKTPGGKLPRSPFMRKLALSAAQSALFNQYLARRLTDGLLRQVLAGDVMSKRPFGGMFVATDLPTEQRRFDAGETVHAGPIFGRKTFRAAGVAAEREAAILQEAGLTLGNFEGFGKLVQGTRRHNLVFAEDLAAGIEPDGICLNFTLPAGSYATVLLQEIMKSQLTDADAAD